jgi:hypothetical protein
MKKLLLSILLTLGVITSSYGATNYINLDGPEGGISTGSIGGNLILYPLSMRPLVLTEAWRQPQKRPFKSPEGYHLVAFYLTKEDESQYSQSSYYEPKYAFDELITIHRFKDKNFDSTSPQNDPEKFAQLFFESEVENTISDLLEAEALLESKALEIEEQEDNFLNQAGGAEDKTIRVLMPSGPFIYEDNAFAFSFVNYVHQTKNNVITESSRIVSTLIFHIENEFFNVGFYKTVSPENTPKELPLEAEKIKQWYEQLNVWKKVKG